jgi:chromosome segregation ATPase
MDEATSGSLSIDTFLAKQEGVLIEYLRKFLQAETRIVLLETGIQELHRKNKDLNEQLETSQTTLNQSIVGLQAVTNERDRALGDSEKLRASLSVCNTRLNEHLIFKTELDQLKETLNSSQADYATLQGNYKIVLAELETLKEKLRVSEEDYAALMEAHSKALAPPLAAEEPELTPASPKKSKKIKSTEPEWTDGKY